MAKDWVLVSILLLTPILNTLPSHSLLIDSRFRYLSLTHFSPTPFSSPSALHPPSTPSEQLHQGSPVRLFVPIYRNVLGRSTPPHLPLKSHDVSTSLWIQVPKGGGLISLLLCGTIYTYLFKPSLSFYLSTMHSYPAPNMSWHSYRQL
jgi:hypothetical protein